VLVYRVFPHLPAAGPDEPGHPLYVHPDQGTGRWDNADLYRAMYVAASASGAIGEAFANLSTWSRAMLPFPSIMGSSRSIGVYRVDEERHPFLNLDDARVLLDRALRPTDVVIRNRPRTQQLARAVHAEVRWAGMSWWSMHRPQWTLHVLWDGTALTVEGVESLSGHPGLLDAARLLAKRVDADIA
jgi:hypothetical protein